MVKVKENPIVECACGCGSKFELYDKWGYKRTYHIGHNLKKYFGDMTPGRQKKIDMIHEKGDKCIKCKIKYDGKNAAIFDFHHRNSDEKSFTLKDATSGHYRWERILKELAKCDMLCANCHRMIKGNEF